MVGYYLYNSQEGENDIGLSIRPVVTLKADVELSVDSNDGWTIN